VLFQDFGDSSLNFEARGFIPQVEWRIIVASELRVAINKAFAEANIEIPFPQRDLHIKDLERLEKILEKRENSPPPDSTD
jgi:small-conductance mechanosensitive channel